MFETLDETARNYYPKMKYANSFEEAAEILSAMEAGDEDEGPKDPKDLRGKLPKLMPVSESTRKKIIEISFILIGLINLWFFNNSHVRKTSYRANAAAKTT